MEKPLYIAILYIGFCLLDTVSGFPIDFSSASTGGLNPLWQSSYLLTAIGFLFAAVAAIFGCICCRNGKGFKEFRNSSGNLAVPEGFVNASNSELTIFPPAGAGSNQICRFDPLPDIRPQVPNLRPAAFSYSEREISSQDWFSEPYSNFPRNRLKYVQEYGRGWFGRVVEGEAQNITSKEKLTKVMVKILHEDATQTDQMYFLHEVKFYRDLKHPNILRLLGRCLETEPFLIILECYPNGDLKSFLSQNLASARALAEQGVTLQMCCNITSGLQFMHENKFIHIDLAARNCLVGPDLTVKIGDYGNSIEIFKSDYYCAGSVALPVRWCAPETLKCTDVTIETREVTPPANIWSLAVVFWEVCEFCKLPYAELNDDQVIVRVLGEKNYFLEKPSMFCLHKDELYHLMKLCWNSPLQRPTASQIHAVLDNLISSGKITQKEVQLDSKRVSEEFEQRWQNLKPNSIPKKDNAVEVQNHSLPKCSIISPKLKNAKVVDSSLVDSPSGVFMSNEKFGVESPRLCLKSDAEIDPEEAKLRDGSDETEKQINENSNEEAALNIDVSNKREESGGKVDFEYGTEVKLPEILKTHQSFKEGHGDVDSWLKGVEINNEEDESFVRKISEAIRDLDAALAMEKTSSSEENSGKSSHQNSPGKDLKESNEPVVDFKLGADASAFKNFTPKSFELSSLQNTEEPQSLNFTYSFVSHGNDEYGQNSLLTPIIENSKNAFNVKNVVFDESLKDDSLLCGQSRNSSDTDDEIWRKRIERGEITEKVKEKSKSIANLMILTHIDASDESDNDLDKPFDRNVNRNSFARRSGSFGKSLTSSNNFGSESDIVHAVLEDEFKESLKKLSNDHKEHGRFDSLGVILPTSARKENVFENLFKSSEATGEVLEDIVNEKHVSKSKTIRGSESNIEEHSSNISVEGEENDDEPKLKNSNNFLGNVASEKLNDNKFVQDEDVSVCLKNIEKDGILVEDLIKCDSRTFNADKSNSSEKNSSHLKENPIEGGYFIVNNKVEFPLVEQKNVESEASDEYRSETLEIAVVVPPSVGSNLKDMGAKELQKEGGEVENNYRSVVPVDDLNAEFIKAERLDLESTASGSRTGDLLLSNIEAQKDGATNEEEVNESSSKESLLVPEIVVTQENRENFVEEQEESAFELDLNIKNVKPIKFVLKDDESTPLDESLVKNEVNLKKIDDAGELKKDFDFPFPLNGEYVGKDLAIQNYSVIIGPCEDFTLDYFKGLKTSSGDLNSKNNFENKSQKNLQNIFEDLRNKEANLDIWDEHLEKAFTQQLKNTNFDEISFRSLSDAGNSISNLVCQGKANEDFMSSNECLLKTIMDFIESEKMHTARVEEPEHINRLTNLTGMGSEEEYDNFKMRTPDDERSSDSGFRDKGSLSESVEDACEGKYNLEDIEAELEEAYVKGVFGSCEGEKEKDLSKDSKNFINFEYEESKFYENEHTDDEDFNNIDGEIEFWQNKEGSDYYPEISEFDPTFSQGWYLHPPEENMLSYNTNVNEDIVNALRNELRESLPIQARSFHEFSGDFCDKSPIEDSKRDLKVQYISDFSIPLSPIIEEQENIFNETSKKNIKNSLLNGSNTNKIRKTIINLMETAKAIDTNTFMQYLDYMVENEGGDLDDIEEAEEESIEVKEEEVSSPLLIVSKDETNMSGSENFEEDIKKAFGDDSFSGSESLLSDAEQNKGALLIEDLESGFTSKAVQETKTKNDSLVVNVDTNEVVLLEGLKPKSYAAFEEANGPEDVLLEVTTDNSENEGLVFTPELLSPDRERSLSEISRSSSGTRMGDALSEITLSSPDLVPDCFSTSVQEIIPNDEANEIMDDLKSSGIISDIEIQSPAKSKTEGNSCSLPNVTSKFKGQQGASFSEATDLKLGVEKLGLNEGLAQTSEKPSGFDNESEGNDQYEMSTSFMGEDEDYNDDEDKEREQKRKVQEEAIDQKADEGDDLLACDSYTGDWESDSSGGEEEMSSSSGEFIWKNGDKELKIKATQATDSENENFIFETTSRDGSVTDAISNETCKGRTDGESQNEDDNEQEEEDNESSTGSSASFTEFVPSSWNSQATPSRSALRSAEKKGDQKEKKSVWFKKQKYHCVYEYPREPSDNEDADNSPYNQYNYDKNTSESQNKHFTFEVNTVELPNKHFPYGISNVIDYSSYTDWDILEGDDADLSLTDTDSDNGLGKNDLNIAKNFDFYTLNPFDYDFNSVGMLNDESEFFVSSSSRPFQGGSSSQFFPGNNHMTVINDAGSLKNVKLENRSEIIENNSKDFVTPDSGVEDSANVTPSDKDLDHQSISSEVDTSNASNVLDCSSKFNFNTEIEDTTDKKINIKPFVLVNGNSSPNEWSAPSSNSPLSPGKLGELRHTRDRLKLDLLLNHNAELGKMMSKQNQQNSLKS